MVPSSATSPVRKAEAHSAGFVLGSIMVVVTMLGLAAAYGLSSSLHHQPSPEASGTAEPTLTRTLVGKEFHIPASWFRAVEQNQQGFATEIDLELQLPLGRAGALRPIEVTLLPLSQVRPSISLLDGVYLHQFMPNELSGPPGLVGKPLYGTEGYENETVWYDALSPSPFVAKCMAAPDAGGPSRCLRTVALTGGIAAVYGFDADLLFAWKDFDPQMKKWLVRIGAP